MMMSAFLNAHQDGVSLPGDVILCLLADEEAGGDFIWAASSFWGIPWIEAALGCDIFASHETGSIHAETPADFKPGI